MDHCGPPCFNANDDNLSINDDGKGKPPVFEFTEDDYIGLQSGNNSLLDRLLQNRWKRAAELGALKYTIQHAALPSRIISPTEYRMVAGLIEGRAPGQRRTPDTMTSLKMPFNANKFNFTKISPTEVLFHFRSTTAEATVIVNQSPIEYCNSLLVPFLDKCLPQVLTDDSLRLAIQMLCLSDRQSLRLGFNSLGAMASVNHQHWHLYYFEYELAIEQLPVVNHLLKGWPIPAIVFEINELLDVEIDKVVTQAMKIVNFCLNQGNIAHNLFLTRTGTSSIRLFIWLVEPRFGSKNGHNINIAFAELTGFFICKTKETFNQIDELRCVQALQSVASHHDKVLDLL